MGKLLCEDLLRKQRVSVYRRSQSDNRKEINKQTTSLTWAWRQLTFNYQQPYSVYPMAKTQVPPLNRVSAAQKQAKTVLQEVGSDTCNDDNIPLAKVASNSWSDSDSDVSLSVLR